MERAFLRGVNLGGWLVLEKWMTPSLFRGVDAVDEYTFMQAPDAKEKLEVHRRTFVREEDFQWLAAHGINAVRIPVGYWVLESDGPYVEATEYLDWAMDMADKYGLKVLIDVHGLPGSQNGRDHSGRIGRALWYRSAAYRDRSLEVLGAIARRYKDRSSLWGLQVINEPWIGLFHWKLRRYYKQAYVRLAAILPQTVAIVFSDAFMPRLLSGALKKTTHTVVMDVHVYHMATPFAKQLSLKWFLKKTRRRQKMLARLSRTQPIIIGEWSGVISHQTMRRVPKEQHDALFRQYVALQQEVYGVTQGWFYWNYKTEGAGQWNFRSEVEAGLITLQNNHADV